MRNFFDSNALWLSMLIGALGYKIFLPLKPSLPWLIFFMLFFTFCKVNPKDLRLHKWHWVVLFLQIALSLAAYAITYLLTGSRFMAQGLMLCFVMPTATAAPIIAGKMGGSIQNLTTFTLLSNFATAIIVPVLFPLVNPLAEKAFWYGGADSFLSLGCLYRCPLSRRDEYNHTQFPISNRQYTDFISIIFLRLSAAVRLG